MTASERSVAASLAALSSAELCRDVRGQFDHFQYRARRATHRNVAGLKPDRLATFAMAQKFCMERLARSQSSPEGAILGLLRLLGRHKHAVVASDHLVSPISHRRQEWLANVHDLALRREHDCGLVLEQGSDQQLGVFSFM